MKRIPRLLCLALCAAAPGLAQTSTATVGELIAALKAQPVNERNWVVIPVAGSGVGRSGTAFHADVTFVAQGRPDYYNDDARVAVAWLPSDRDASADAVQYMTLPGDFNNGSRRFPDFLGRTEFGAIVVAAVDLGGALDPRGDITANVRIWTTSNCLGEASMAYRAGHWLDSDHGSAIGLTLNDGFRTNAAIVNADTAAHEWRIRYASVGAGPASEITVTVPAASLKIVGLPPKGSGPIAVTIEPEAAGLAWTGWAASVDNASGDGWYSPLTPF